MKKILFPLCIMMAILILVIGMTTVSFSWFEPSSLSGSGLSFKHVTAVNSNECIVNTYSGQMNAKGEIVYYDTALSSGNGNNSVSISSDSTSYFKTVITNNNTSYDANISLYLKNLTINTSADVAIIYPTNTYRTFTSNQQDLHLVRNAYVEAKDTKSGTGEITVEWFIRCAEGTASFDADDIYIMYN